MKCILWILIALAMTPACSKSGSSASDTLSHPIVGTWTPTGGRPITFGSNRKLTYQIVDDAGVYDCVINYAFDYAIADGSFTLSNQSESANNETECQALSDAIFGSPWRELNIDLGMLPEGTHAFALPNDSTLQVTPEHTSSIVTYTR